jgi:DNA polymerase-4
MNNIFFHIDVNNAFLSWSAIDLLKHGHKYDIRDRCAVIGGDESKRHGIVLSKSGLAKKRGIITGESLYSARKKCPELEIYNGNYELYGNMSHKLFELLSNYTPDIQVFSIDECSIDYSKVKNLPKPNTDRRCPAPSISAEPP